MIRSMTAALLSCVVLAAEAQEGDAIQDIPSLLNPTPKDRWRELSADRPDFTESPYTVDAGALQIELSFFDYTKSGDSDAWALAPANIKVGLLESVDIQFVIEPYLAEEDETGTRDGIGDSQIRLKVNLWGNEGGQTAMAIMPFIQIPTASDELGHNHVEGGVILPFAMELTEGVGLGLMLEADFVYDESAENYETELVGTGAIGFDLTEEVGAYAEIIGSTGAEGDSPHVAMLGLGATYQVSANLQFDAGVNIGLSRDADDLSVFSGVTLRF